jgi:aspartate-semialdehyde dehydrogenase
VGASSVAGKELNDALAESPLAASRITLLDEEGVAGRLAAAGDDISIVQKLDAGCFDDIDFAFFAGAPQDTLRYWRAAQQAGAAIVDLTGALEPEPAVLVRAPWILAASAAPQPRTDSPQLDLSTPAVVAAHPATMMLLAAANQLSAKLPVRSIAATLLEPASAHGQAAMDELHQQTVSLLSFQSIPRAQFDAQSAFNLLPALGEDAHIDLDATRTRVAREYAVLAGSAAPDLALQVVQVPVFHASAMSAFLVLDEPATIAQVETALRGGIIEVPGAGSEPPTNVSAAGQAQILVRVSAALPSASRPLPRTPAEATSIAPARASTCFWLWMAADNLKLAAFNAIACAGELARLRPRGKVQ